jgi:hypothetical protein
VFVSPVLVIDGTDSEPSGTETTPEADSVVNAPVDGDEAPMGELFKDPLVRVFPVRVVFIERTPVLESIVRPVPEETAVVFNTASSIKLFSASEVIWSPSENGLVVFLIIVPIILLLLNF